MVEVVVPASDSSDHQIKTNQITVSKMKSAPHLYGGNNNNWEL